MPLPQQHYKDIDPSLYYSEEFIAALESSHQKNLVIVTTSWSGSALQFPRSINIGARQSRDVPHHLVYAQILKTKGIKLKIYYLAFDNSKHFNHKDKRAVDNVLSKAYVDYVLSVYGIELDADQFEPIYLNPRYKEKDGDLIETELPVVQSKKGPALAFTGENAIVLRELKNKLAAHNVQGHHIIGMTSHSGGAEMTMLGNYLGVELIGSSDASLHYGTKEGNKELFDLAEVRYVYGSRKAVKELGVLLDDCYRVAEHTKCKTLIIKHNSSSAGKGNLDVDIADCYYPDGSADFEKLRETAYKAILAYKHPEKDKDIKAGAENFYMRKIREIGAVVEAKLQGKEILSPGSFGVVKKNGEVVVEYIYDQLLGGNAGQNFGGSLGPSEVEEKHLIEMENLTRHVGEVLAQQGGSGYFGMDFLRVDDRELIVIEANLRKTGTKYPWIMAYHLLGAKAIKEKTILHNDNITLPFSLTDLTGRQETQNHFMDELYRWLQLQLDVTFRHDHKTGTLVTFDTHTAGKIGVLAIGNNRPHVKTLMAMMEDKLKHFGQIIYPEICRAENLQGINFASTRMAKSFELIEPSAINPTRGLVEGPIVDKQHRQRSKTLIGRVKNSGTKFLYSSKSKGSELCEKLSGRDDDMLLTQDYCASLNAHMLQAAATKALKDYHPPQPIEYTQRQRMTVRPLVFAILGRTRTSDELLIQAAQRDIKAYRMSENSDIQFDENTREGSISKVCLPKIDERTGNWKIVYDEQVRYPLPTVIYDYDFSASRRMVYSTRGDRIVADKITTLKELIAKIGAVMFNNDTATDVDLKKLSPLRSQWALAHLFRDHAPDIAAIYPRTIALYNSQDNHHQIVALLSSGQNFYLKPTLAERRPDRHISDIYAHKIVTTDGDTQLVFDYTVKQKIHDRDILNRKSSAISLRKLEVCKLLALINSIKIEMGFAPDVQFFIQEALTTPEFKDQMGRSLSQKLRVVSQHNPITNQLAVTSIYGIYGGPNAYLGYVGDPNIYISNSLTSFPGSYSCAESVILAIKQLAIRCHTIVENFNQARMGELVTDFILTEAGPLPLKISAKPERPEMEFVAKQTHFGYFLEGCREARVDFITKFFDMEDDRKKMLIDEIIRLHREVFYPLELARKNKVDAFGLMPPTYFS